MQKNSANVYGVIKSVSRGSITRKSKGDLKK